MKKIFGQPAGFKRIYNGFIPEGWKLLSLSEKAEIEYGISDPINTLLAEGVKILSLPNVDKHGEFVLKEIPLIEREKVKKEDYLKKGDLLFNWRNGSKEHLGKTAYFNLDGEFTHVGFLLRIRTNHKELHPYYLKCYINFLRNNGFFLGAKIQVNNTFNKEELGALPLMYPEPKEQKAIAKLISSVDTVIDKTNQLINKKKLHKKALTQYLLTGKKRFPKFDREVWKEVQLGEIFKEIKDTNDGGDSHSIMTISSRLGLISQEDKFDRVIAGDSLKKYTQLQQNDFAYNKGNSKTYQMGCIYQLEDRKSALVPFVYICFSPTDAVHSAFYKHWFLAHGLDRQLKKIITSGARGDGLLNVNTTDFFKLKVPFPSKEEQAEIAQIFDAIDKEIDLLEKQRDLLKQQKRGLMQKLLTGKIRVTIDETEKATNG